MTNYILVRLAGIIPTAVLITLISFAIMQTTPGDPAVLLLQQSGIDPTPEAIAQIRSELALDKPFWQSYLLWLQQVVQGDLGHSFYSKQPVLSEIMQRIPATLELTLTAMLLSLAIALTLGLLAAKYENKWPDTISGMLAVLAVSLPSYWLGLILIYLFAVKLQWLPAVGRGSAANLVLPAVSLCLTSAAVHARLLRAGLLEASGQAHAQFACAKGLTPWQVLVHHALRLSLLPVVTSLGNTFGAMLGGTVIIESIFAWPGLGKMVMDAIFNRDYPVIQGYVLIMAVLYTIVNMLADFACAWLDPRLRLGGERKP